MRILVLSDTHIPKTASDLPKKVYGEIAMSDMVIHAGDFIEKEFYDKLASLKTTKAVYGNMDPSELRNILSPKEIIRVAGKKIGIIHGYGAPRELIDTVKSEFKNVDCIVFGHSHNATNIVKDGVLFFNPGSPTDKFFTRVNSYGILEVTKEGIEGRIVEL